MLVASRDADQIKALDRRKLENIWKISKLGMGTS